MNKGRNVIAYVFTTISGLFLIGGIAVLATGNLHQRGD